MLIKAYELLAPARLVHLHQGISFHSLSSLFYYYTLISIFFLYLIHAGFYTRPLWHPLLCQATQCMVTMAHTTVLFDHILTYQSLHLFFSLETTHCLCSQLRGRWWELVLAVGGQACAEIFPLLMFTHVNGCCYAFSSIGMALICGEGDHVTSFNIDGTLFYGR